MSLGALAAGWHGKLPTLGDFATRRLPPDFVEPWDRWLDAGLRALQSRAGGLDAYLASPSWRFVLMPGALPGAPGQRAWAGVLMPSVDRVGRYYPLTLAQALGSLPADAAALAALQRWLRRLDDLAADALHQDWPPEQLEAALAVLGPAPSAAPAAATRLDDPPLWRVELPQADADAAAGPDRPLQAWLAAQAAARLQRSLHGRALWFHEGGEAPALVDSRGLEPGRLVAELLGRAARPT